MCRKFTGALIPHTFTVTRGQVEPPFESHPSYKLYKSSETGQRGFCGNCGSSMTFHYAKKPEEAEVHFGTLDEEVLIGRKVEGSEWMDEYGTHCEREGGFGEEWLKNDPYHIYAENSVPGVTELKGRKYLGYYTDGKPYTGRLSDHKRQ